MNNPLQQVNALGQSVWYDNIRRGHIKSGELQRLIDSGITGLTSNPTIFEKAIAGSADYDDALLALVGNGKSASDIFESLATQDIRDAADLMRSIYEQTDGADGFVSFEVSPHLAHDTEGTVSEARRLFALLDRPNVMIKVPATPEGVPAVRQLISEGINVNVTLIFSLEAYAHVREAYIGGLEELAASGGDVSRVASVASFFVSRVDTAVDAILNERIQAGSDDLENLVGKAAIANAKLAYRDFKGAFGNDRFAALRAKDTFAGQANERTWMIGILRNKIADHFRRQFRGVWGDDAIDQAEFATAFFDSHGYWKNKDPAWPRDGSESLSNRDFWRVLDECMGKLPDGIASVFTLREMEGLGTREICKILNITATNLGARLYRARMGLRKCLDQNWFRGDGRKDVG